MPLNNHLKEYRSKLGVNQQEMGALVQTSRQTISQIERGDYSPSVTLALKLAKACGVTVEDIFEYTEVRKMSKDKKTKEKSTKGINHFDFRVGNLFSGGIYCR